MIKFENFHIRPVIESLSWVDRLKILTGAKIDMSVCGKLNINMTDNGKYEYVKFGDMHTEVRVWKNDPPKETLAHTRFHRIINETNKEN